MIVMAATGPVVFNNHARKPSGMPKPRVYYVFIYMDIYIYRWIGIEIADSFVVIFSNTTWRGGWTTVIIIIVVLHGTRLMRV